MCKRVEKNYFMEGGERNEPKDRIPSEILPQMARRCDHCSRSIIDALELLLFFKFIFEFYCCSIKGCIA